MNLLLKTRPLLFNPMLASRIGLNEAIVVQQLAYWLEETTSGIEQDGRKWIWNSLTEWQKQFPFWSEDTVKRAFASLREKGVISVEQLNKSKHDRTNFYSINWGCDHLNDKSNLPSSMGAASALLHAETTTEKKIPVEQARPVPLDKILSMYNQVCGNVFKKAARLTGKREKQIKACWAYKVDGKLVFQSAQFWSVFFNKCIQNPHWRGENGGAWKASLEFVTRKDIMERVVDEILVEMEAAA